jgi:uroporphyrinogen decarboxylase
MIKNDLFLEQLKGETVERPPVWMMRQAGRYLNLSLCVINMISSRCQTPELAAKYRATYSNRT